MDTTTFLTAAQKHEAEKQRIATHLEALTHDFETSINKHDFNILSPTWQVLSPRFTFDSWIGDSSNLPEREDARLKWLASLDAVSKRHKEYHIRLFDISTNVHADLMSAECFVNMETTGNPPGVVRQAVAVLGFRLVKGKWKCLSHKGFQGPYGAGEIMNESEGPEKTGEKLDEFLE